MRSAAVVAAAVVGLSVSGCGSPGACPMFERQSGSEVNADAYVAAHPGRVAELGACLGPASVCGLAQAEAHLAPVSATDAVIRFGDQPVGRQRVRVVLLDAAGRTVLDVTGTFVVTHSGIPGCPNTSYDSGGVQVTADGTLAS